MLEGLLLHINKHFSLISLLKSNIPKVPIECHTVLDISIVSLQQREGTGTSNSVLNSKTAVLEEVYKYSTVVQECLYWFTSLVAQWPCGQKPIPLIYFVWNISSMKLGK